MLFDNQGNVIFFPYVFVGMEKINFSGGEPFLHQRGDFLGKLVQFCKQELRLPSVSIVSNGSLITEKWFQKYGIFRCTVYTCSVLHRVPMVCSCSIATVLSSVVPMVSYYHCLYICLYLALSLFGEP